MRLISRLFGLLVVVCLGMAVWVVLLPGRHGTGSRAAVSVAAAPSAAPDAAPPQRQVRVVYPDATTAPSMISSPKLEARIDPAVAPAVAAPAPQVVAPEIPRSNDADAARLAQSEPGSQTDQKASPAAPSGLPIDLNTASIEALNQIPGGGSIGRTIVAHRPYKSVDDLLNKRVVRRSVFDRIRLQVAAN